MRTKQELYQAALRTVALRRQTARTICRTAFSTGITQNRPSPLAIAVSTKPGRTSVT